MAKAPIDIRSLARSYTEMAIQTLAGIAQNGEQEAARVRASEALLDRGWGKPPQSITGDADNPLEIVHRIERHIVHAKDSDR